LASRWDPPFWIGDRLFTQEDIDLICWTAEYFGTLSRTELALTICENLPWKAPNGQLRVNGCVKLLEQLASEGIIQIPEKRELGTYRPARLRSDPLPVPRIATSLSELRPVTVNRLFGMRPWRSIIRLASGALLAPSAHQRYWIWATLNRQRTVVGLLLFSAAARNVAVRDAWLDWDQHQQQRFRNRVVANSRYLILPGVHVRYLASHALGLALRRLPGDWKNRYGYAPVVLETFVTPPWRGTCYRAANWVHVGQTTGQGRQDRNYEKAGVVREVFVYPLRQDWRQALTEEASEESEEGRTAGRAPAQDTGGSTMITAEQQLNQMVEERIRQRYEALAPFLNEKQRRLFAAAEAIAYGKGGQKRVALLVGMSEKTVSRGVWELRNPETVEPERVRRPGGGRKPTTASDPELLSDLERLISPETRGDPQSPLRWTCKSTRKLASELRKMKAGRTVSSYLVGDLLRQMGYSLQAARKMREGTRHPDRDAQFHYINATIADYQRKNQPVISVDTKKKELVGDFKNPVWCLRSCPQRRLGQRRHRSRYCSLCRSQHPRLVAKHGARGLPGRKRVADHRRRRRQQQFPVATVEGRTAELGRRDRPKHRRLPLSSRDKQVEQGGAQALFPHHTELARQAVEKP